MTTTAEYQPPPGLRALMAVATCDRRASLAEVARVAGCSKGAVMALSTRNYIRRLPAGGWRVAPRGRRVLVGQGRISRTCVDCGAEFTSEAFGSGRQSLACGPCRSRRILRKRHNALVEL